MGPHLCETVTCSSQTHAVKEIISPFKSETIHMDELILKACPNAVPRLIFSKKGTYILVVKSAALCNVWTKRSWLN